MTSHDLFNVTNKTGTRYWAILLLKARSRLWKGKTNSANKLYGRILDEIQGIKAKGLQDEILIHKAEARLGLWAVGYLKRKQDASGFKEILEGSQTAFELWIFVCKVFILDQNTGPEALHAYLELIRLRPSKKNAMVLWAAVKDVQYSAFAALLLDALASILTEDLYLAEQCCLWALASDHLENAQYYARKIVRQDPNHINANRCLGYQAEKRQEWKIARDHYLKSQDWLRVAVCHNHLEDYSQALKYLQLVAPDQQQEPTWLYHAGWANYKLSAFEQARQHWQLLSPESETIREPLLAAVEKRQNIQFLTVFDQLDRPIPEHMPDSLKRETYFRRGAVRLILRRETKRAQVAFDQAEVRLQGSPLQKIFLAASVNFPRQDLNLDKKTYMQLKQQYGDASIYLLLRALWTATLQPDLAFRYLQKSVHEGVSRHLPDYGINALQWILYQLASNEKQGRTNIDSSELDPELYCRDETIFPYVCAVRSSLLVKKLRSNPIGIVSWVNLTPKYELNGQTAWNGVRAVYYAFQSDWFSAIMELADHPLPDLEEKLSYHGLYHSIQQKQWSNSAEFLERALQANPDDAGFISLALQLDDLIMKKHWILHDFPFVANRLLRFLKSQPGNTRIHHNLAIMNLLRAGDLDQQGNHDTAADHWKQSMGHWAVVLSDTQYWLDWKDRRCEVYGTEIEVAAINDLIDNQIPDLLREYFNERDDKTGFTHLGNRYYQVLLEEESDIIDIIRRIIRKGTKGIFPSQVLLWLSPVLIKEHVEKDIVDEFISSVPISNLSALEIRKLQTAYSRLREIHILGIIGQFDLALNKLASLEHESDVTQEELQNIPEERAFLLENYVRDLMNQALWDKALERALQLWKLRPKPKIAEALYLEISLKWVKQRLKDEEYELGTNQLKKLRKHLTKPSPDLDALLAEALASWGHEQYEEQLLDSALRCFEEAIGLDSVNPKARDGLAMVYYSRMVNEMKNNRFSEGYQFAQKMYSYMQNEATATEYARTCALYAESLANLNLHQAAIQIVESALKIPYDRSEFQLELFLSSLLTNYGAQLLNSGQRTIGIMITKQAIEYDPANHLARNNLRNFGVYL